MIVLLACFLCALAFWFGWWVRGEFDNAPEMPDDYDTFSRDGSEERNRDRTSQA